MDRDPDRGSADRGIPSGAVEISVNVTAVDPVASAGAVHFVLDVDGYLQ